MAVVSLSKKITTVLGTVSNWYMLPLDKLGLVDRLTYRFSNGTSLRCRSRSTDINEACVVFGGLEYPLEPCKLPGDAMVVDLGGNIGAFTVWLAAINPGARIFGYIFEPHPGNAALIRENLALNSMERFEVIEAAVAGEDGMAKFDISGGFDAFKLGDNGAMEVKTLRLSSFLAIHGISKVDLLKMDIEGAEYDIIARDIDALAPAVRRIILEFHAPLDSVQSKAMIKQLSAHYVVDVIEEQIGGGVIDCRARD